MRRRLFGALIGSALLCAASLRAAEVDASGPSVLISSAATAMLHDLDAHRADYTRDPAQLEAVVTRVLLPYFDTNYAAQLVLGQYWRTASDAQRKRFVAAFYHSMLRTYSSALASFTGDRLKVLPFNGDATAKSATVRTQVRKSDGAMIGVNYNLRRTEQGWRVWDVVIEGISYVKSFRDDYGAEVQRRGLDSLINRLEGPGGTQSSTAATLRPVATATATTATKH
jgi:phospholipid transport system substrate-binding protein